MSLTAVRIALCLSVLFFSCGAFEDRSPFDNNNTTLCYIEMSWSTPSYPDSLQHPEQAKTTDYHGVQVVDKFAWLEDPRSTDVQAWVDAQNLVTESYLKQLDFKDKMTARCVLSNISSILHPFLCCIWPSLRM